MSGPRDIGLLVRPELPADHGAVYDVVRRAFERDGEARLVEALRRVADPQISLVAVRDERVVGHVFFSPVTIEGEGDRTPAALGLAPLAVAPEWQRQGIGSALARAGLEAARRSGHGVVVVLGHPDFYPRFGFRPASGRGLRYEASGHDDAFMVVELTPGALGDASGVVRYLPLFAEF